MPPEPFPYIRDNKKHHDRSSTAAAAAASDGIRSVARWRDSHHGTTSGPPPPRDGAGGRWNDFRSSSRSQGRGKQGGGGGGYQLVFSDDSAHHGCMPFRATSDRMIEGDDNSFRPSALAARGGGGNAKYYYGRSSRGSLSHKDSKGGHLWESADVSSIRHQHDTTTSASAAAQRSVSDLLTYASHPQSDIENSSSWDHLRLKDDNDKLPTVDALDTDHHKTDKEHSLGPIGWKPLKWNRSSSLSSRGSGFSHTSSSRSMGADSDETKLDLPSGRPTPAQSDSGDAAAGDVAYNAPFEDSCARKKQRLGWGQGLAKYEKQKVEGTDETISKSGLNLCAMVAKPSQSIPSLPDKCLRGAFPSECASPVTTSSVACSSSPGIDDKPHIKAANNDTDTCNLSGSPAHLTRDFQSCLEEFSASLEHLSSASNLSSLLSDLLQLEDASSGDSDFVKSTAMNKLLLVKSELSKALEKTECEIDLFENELKLLNSEFKSTDPCSVTSDILHVGAFSKVCQNSIPLQMVSSTDMHVDMPDLCNEGLEGIHGEVKDDDIDSPGTATSKFIEPSCMEKAVSAYSVGKHDGCSRDVVAARPSFSGQPWFSPSFYKGKSASISNGEDGNQLLQSSISLPALSNLNPDCDFIDLVLVSNRKSARKALEVFNKLLPADWSEIDIWGTCSLSWQNNKSLVKHKLAARKCFQRFKERVLTLKFRALHHLWIEDMRLLSIRKYRAKSQKRVESSSKTPHIVYQKHRSSIRSRFTSPGSLTLVPTSEIVDFTSKLLSDSQIKLYRDSLKMPALIDEKEKRMLRFVSNNGLVEDPCAAEKERVMINPWTPKEKEVFLEKLATLGKDFKKIASYLDHKTTADCVEFYYKNHKSESFEKIKKNSELKKQERGLPTNTYLMTSSKKWNREVNAASLDLLGEASVIAAHADSSFQSQQLYVSRSFLGGHYHPKTCYGDDASYEKSSSLDILGNEREATAADTLAGFCGALSSEAMSSCVTSSVDPGENCQEGKFLKNSVLDQPLTPSFTQSIDDEETCSDESCGEMDSVDWTDEEKSNFLCALRSYGKDFVKIARCVRSRSRDQCKVFFSKARKSLGLDVIHLGTDREGTPLSDANGGRSDTEDTCVLETESAICSTQSCSKLEMDYLPLTNCEASKYAASNHQRTDELDSFGEKNGMEQLNHLQTTKPERSGENNGMELLNHGDGVTVGEDLHLEKCDYDHKVEFVPDGEDSSFKGIEENLNGAPDIVQLDNVSKVDAASIYDVPVMLHVDAGFTHSTESAKREQTVIPVEELASFEGIAVVHSMSSDETENMAMPIASPECLKIESGSEQIMVAVGADECNRNVKTGVGTSTKTSSGCFGLDSNINKSSSYQAVDASFRQSFSLTQNHQPQIPMELLHSVQKAQTSWKQKENTPVSANMVLPGSSLFHYEDHLRQGAASSATLNFEGTLNEQHQKSAGADVFQRYLLHPHCLDREILRGYPLQMLSKKDANGHVDCMNSEKQSIVHKSMVNGNFQPAQFAVHDVHREKRNGSQLSHSLAELPLLPQNNEQSTHRRMRSHSQGSSDGDDSRRFGDVKLFGQILSHPLTSHKTNLTTPENDNNGTTLPRSSSRTFDLKFTDQGAERSLMISKLDTNKFAGLDDFPARSYGFWDGSRIQTGLSSMPDSSILLTKYPSTFSEAPLCGDQHSLAGVIRRNDRNLGCVSIYPPLKDLSSNGSSSDYQVYRSSYDGAKVQPFTVDLKQHQDAFSDVQKRNGLEMSSFQKQARGGGGGMNGMGTGIVVGGGGGGCTGVSDPVAAIKMHYASTERYGGQSGSISSSSSSREEEKWIGGDVGR